ncbi:MAG TPA: DUF3761 domain-containing protein [Acidobacteriaceae bacterium]|nr:DUF3761 domain-containing protein [Acidobacteriaceae bacterium]
MRQNVVVAKARRATKPRTERRGSQLRETDLARKMPAMNTRVLFLVVVLMLTFVPASFAQAPAVAPTTPATVICKDGTSSKGGRGACSGHGGIDHGAPSSIGHTPSAGADPKAGPAESAGAGDVHCKDGTASKGGRGACSGHGGIDHGAAASVPSSRPSPTPPPLSIPTAGPSRNAPSRPTTPANDNGTPTATCKDGTTSFAKHHQGACSHHGGVAQWLDGTN